MRLGINSAEKLCLLNNEGVEISQLLNRGTGRNLEVLLLGFASLRTLITEDKVHLKRNPSASGRRWTWHMGYLSARTRQIRTEHNHPRSGV